jgi:hypothetical protein
MTYVRHLRDATKRIVAHFHLRLVRIDLDDLADQQQERSARQRTRDPGLQPAHLKSPRRYSRRFAKVSLLRLFGG